MQYERAYMVLRCVSSLVYRLMCHLLIWCTGFINI